MVSVLTLLFSQRLRQRTRHIFCHNPFRSPITAKTRQPRSTNQAKENNYCIFLFHDDLPVITYIMYFFYIYTITNNCVSRHPKGKNVLSILLPMGYLWQMYQVLA